MRRMNVVDSPPGMTRPSRPSRCSGLRTSTTSAPSARSIAACSRKLPCTARTPIRRGSTGKSYRRGLQGPGRAKLRRVSAIAVLLALASSATWGVADFCGGLLSRRLPTIPVTVISQAAGFAALLAALAIAGGGVDARPLWLGVLAGLGGGTGLAAFYKALSLGPMSMVSPIVACGAVVPFAISIATGERPSGLAVGGAALALTGAVLASTEERCAPEPNRVRAVAIAALAAVALGLFTYFLGLGSREGSALSTLVGARVGSLALLLDLGAGPRSNMRDGGWWGMRVAAGGVLDAGGT